MVLLPTCCTYRFVTGKTKSIENKNKFSRECFFLEILRYENNEDGYIRQKRRAHVCRYIGIGAGHVVSIRCYFSDGRMREFNQFRNVPEKSYFTRHHVTRTTWPIRALLTATPPYIIIINTIQYYYDTVNRDIVTLSRRLHQQIRHWYGRDDERPTTIDFRVNQLSAVYLGDHVPRYTHYTVVHVHAATDDGISRFPCSSAYSGVHELYYTRVRDKTRCCCCIARGGTTDVTRFSDGQRDEWGD
jgi:hypothetical protein